MSGNHGGTLDGALEFVRTIASTGVRHVKFQTYTPETLTIRSSASAFRVQDEHELWGGRSLYELYEEAHTPWSWHEPLFQLCRDLNLIPFSSPFDPSAVELLEGLGCSLYKVASAEIVDLPLIRLIAGTGKPMVISTGMATMGEIDAALEAARSVGNGDVTLLACTSAYPALAIDSRLANIAVLREAFSVPVGLSDHTMGIGVSVAAVALGAVMVEKHVTLDRSDGGVDSDFSLTPTELSTLCVEVERAWEAVQAPAFVGPVASEEAVRRLRRSLYVVVPVKAGDVVSTANVRSIRPSGGLAPDDFALVEGRVFRRDVDVGTPMSWDLV